MNEPASSQNKNSSQLSREELEEQLYDLQELFSLVTENNPFNYFWKDKGLVYRGCNQRFANLAGFKQPSEVIGKTDHDMPWGINNEVGAAACQSSDLAVIKSGKEQMHIEEKIINENGSECWTETSKVPIRNRMGQIVGVLGALEDISKRKEAEAKLADAYQNLETLIRMDPLTGVSNRRHFNEILTKEWSIASRIKSEIAFVLIDVDNFKHFNDSFGHQAGDDCLEKVAATAKAALGRPNDFIARYGGEEFVVLLPNTDLSGAMEIAEKIRSNIEKISISIKNETPHITVSIGISTCSPTPLMNHEAILAQADTALYKAKADGRNCTRVHKHIETSA